MTWKTSILAACATTLGIAIAIFAIMVYLNSANSGVIHTVSTAQCEDHLANGRILGRPEDEVLKLLGEPISHSYTCNGIYGYECLLSDKTKLLHVQSRAGLTTVAEIRENHYLK